MKNEAVSSSEIGDFYNVNDITSFWEHLHRRHMHVGFWDDTTPDDSLYEGSRRLTQKMVDFAEVDERNNFIDLGCGFGIPGIELVKKKGCRLTGLTVSDYQLEEAGKKAELEGITQKISFYNMNAIQTSFEDNSFDSGWYFESIFHMGHAEALKEARRILQPGSSLIIADFPKFNSVSKDDETFIKESFFINSFLTFDEYSDFLEKFGFEIVDFQDISKETLPTWFKYVDAVKENKDTIIKISDAKTYQEQVEFWEKIARAIERTIGYVLIKAQAV